MVVLLSLSKILNILGLTLIKLNCIIILLYLDTIKKVRNELDGACCLPLVMSTLP